MAVIKADLNFYYSDFVIVRYEFQQLEGTEPILCLFLCITKRLLLQDNSKSNAYFFDPDYLYTT